MKNKAVIAFVPVLHKGYIDFFSKNKGDIFIFDQSLINTFVHLTRDLRVIDPKLCKAALQAILPKRTISLATIKILKQINKEKQKVIMPEDEVSQVIFDTYLKDCEVEYVSIFLRWNRFISLAEHQIPSHRKITTEKFHRQYIKDAENEAQKSSDWWRQIGALIIKDKKVLFKGHNHHIPSDHHLSTFGDPRSNFDAGQHQEIFTSIHGEASLVAQAANEGVSLKGTTLYVTTFPCPNCARLIAKAGITKVFYSKGYSLLDAEKILNHFEIEVFLVQ